VAERTVELPLVPFPVLLLQKLQGWDDHRTAVEERYRKKVPFDEKDLWWALNAGLESWLGEFRAEGGGREIAEVWKDEEMFTEEVLALTGERVDIFCELNPSLMQAWRDLGFGSEIPAVESTGSFPGSVRLGTMRFG